jgi:hypothetical protein
MLSSARAGTAKSIKAAATGVIPAIMDLVVNLL